jgi:hypothetical protein
MKRLIFALLLLAIPVHPAGVGSGKTSCPVSGAKAAGSVTGISTWTIQAPGTNLGTINFGGSNVTSTTGLQLYPNGSYTFQPQANAVPYSQSNTYFICSNSADGITFTYVQ